MREEVDNMNHALERSKSVQNNNNNRINSLRQICTIRRAISLPNKECTK